MITSTGIANLFDLKNTNGYRTGFYSFDKSAEHLAK